MDYMAAIAAAVAWEWRTELLFVAAIIAMWLLSRIKFE
jgi:hypothetical protein